MYTNSDKRILSVLKRQRPSFKSLMSKSRLSMLDELEIERMFLHE